MSIRRRFAVLAATTVAASALALSGAAGPASAGAPQLTPRFPTLEASWPSGTGPTAGNPHGTLMGDATVRPTRDPSTSIPIAPMDGQPFSAWGTTGGRAMTDAGLVGLALTGSDGTLWLLDLADGTHRSRAVPGIGAAARVIGATDSAWVTAANGQPAAEVTVWPFDGTASAPVILPSSATALSAGSAGLVLADLDPTTTTLALQQLPAGSRTTLTTWPRSDGDRPRLLATSGGAIAWATWSGIGVWEPATGTRAVPSVDAFDVEQLAVAPGALAMVNEFVNVDWYVGASFVIDAPDGVHPATIASSYWLDVWASATTSGAPAIGVGRRETADPDVPRAPQFVTWEQWTPPATELAVVLQPPSPASAAVGRVVGSNGGLGVTYATGEDRRSGWAAYDVRGAAVVPVVRATGTDLSTEALAVSGRRSAALQRDLRLGTRTLVLRNGALVTARIPLPSLQVAMSGPFVATRSGWASAAPVRVLGPTGGLVATAAAVSRFAEDGTRLAYVQRSGALLLLDVVEPPSRSNPRVLSVLCAKRRLDCVQWIGITGRWVVAEANHRLVVVDSVTGARRSVALGAFHGASASGRLVLVTSGEAARTVDLGARTLALRALPTGTTVLTGRSYARPVPAPGGATQVAVAPIPAANGSLGHPRVLGPWTAYGRYVSTAFPWRPQFSTTDPLSSWSLVLRSSSGRVVGRWSGRASTGEIAGIRWSARDLAGRRVAAGTYRWTLTGKSAYGAPVSVLGSGAATGTVRVVAQARAGLTASVTTRASATYRVATIVARLRAGTSRSPVTGALVELWQRSATGHWSRIADSITSASGTAILKATVRATGVYQLRHPADPRTRASATSAFTIRR